jgi:hypothetical protein
MQLDAALRVLPMRAQERVMNEKYILLDGLPTWARAIGEQLADELIETHMSMPHAILAARCRLEVSERLGPRRRALFVLEARRTLH